MYQKKKLGSSLGATNLVAAPILPICVHRAVIARYRSGGLLDVIVPSGHSIVSHIRQLPWCLSLSYTKNNHDPPQTSHPPANSSNLASVEDLTSRIGIQSHWLTHIHSHLGCPLIASRYEQSDLVAVAESMAGCKQAPSVDD